MKTLGDYFGMLTPVSIGILLGIVTIVFLIYFLRRAKPSAVHNNKLSRNKKSQPLVTESNEEKELKPQRGFGNVKAVVAYKLGKKNILDFTTIPEPVGHVIQIDTSLPRSGGHCLVIDKEKEGIVDSDERDIAVKEDETPSFAYICTTWRTAIRFWTARVPWWKSVNSWFVAGVLAVLFILGLVTLG